MQMAQKVLLVAEAEVVKWIIAVMENFPVGHPMYFAFNPCGIMPLFMNQYLHLWCIKMHLHFIWPQVN